MDSLFSLLLAGAIIVSMKVIGVTLIAAAIIIPASSARMLTDSFNKMIIISVTIGSFTALIGMFASFYLDAASGATIVLTGAAVFILSMGYSYIKRITHRVA